MPIPSDDSESPDPDLLFWWQQVGRHQQGRSADSFLSQPLLQPLQLVADEAAGAADGLLAAPAVTEAARSAGQVLGATAVDVNRLGGQDGTPLGGETSLYAGAHRQQEERALQPAGGGGRLRTIGHHGTPPGNI